MVSIKKNRTSSFIIVTLVYLFSTGVGVLVYSALGPSVFAGIINPSKLYALRLLIADVAATVFVFAFSVVFGNASVYDPYWSVQPIVILFATMAERVGDGKPVTIAAWLIIAVVTLWGVRLTANWAYTFGNLTHQDWRYTMLHDTTGAFYPLVNLVGIHLVPTLVVYFCTLPAALAIYLGLDISPLSIPFLLLSLGATVMQGISDLQMQRFRKSKVGGFIRVGLWKYSRHPNYLGEILMWWGVGLSVVALEPRLWHLLLGAVLNTLLFCFVSIPMAEKRQSRKDGFEEYKAQTRILLPLPK